MYIFTSERHADEVKPIADKYGAVMMHLAFMPQLTKFWSKQYTGIAAVNNGTTRRNIRNVKELEEYLERGKDQTES